MLFPAGGAVACGGIEWAAVAGPISRGSPRVREEHMVKPRRRLA